MRKERITFETQAEARAFKEGVEYVNDSACICGHVYQLSRIEARSTPDHSTLGFRWACDVTDDDR